MSSVILGDLLSVDGDAETWKSG